jgi:glycosyltransferase involved in cell wall biosynthesis
MRVLILTGSFLPVIGGAEISVHNLGEGLVSLGHNVLVCAAGAKGELSHRHSYELKRYRSPRGSWRTGLISWWLGAYLLKIAWQWQPDVVHVHFAYPTGYAAVKFKRLLRLPVIMTCHGGDINNNPETGYGYRLDAKLDRKVRFAVRHADYQIAIGSRNLEVLVELGVERGHIEVIPNCINCRLLAQSDPRARKKLGIPENRQVILTVGRNHHVKGFANLIRAMSLVKEHHPGAMCLIVGRDVLELAPLVKDLGLAEYVSLFPQANPVGIDILNNEVHPVNKVINYYHAADIYVMSSFMESLPVSIMEAMASGLPVVATLTDGIEDLVKDGENGFLVPVGNVEALAASLIKLLDDAQLIDKFGRVAQEKALSYDQDAIGRKYGELYEKAKNYNLAL